MNLYIQIENSTPINHPAFENNLIQAFGSVPSNWESFIRVEKPVSTVYQIFDSNTSSYAKVNGVWTDVWALRDMTDAEKITKQQAVQDEFNNREQASNWSAWTLDEATCTMIPPITRPDIDENKISQGIFTFWCGADANWKDSPVKPRNNCKFDFFAWDWVAL